MKERSLAERMRTIKEGKSPRWLSRPLRENTLRNDRPLGPSDKPKPEPTQPTNQPRPEVDAGIDRELQSIRNEPTDDLTEVQDQNNQRHGRRLNERQQHIQDMKKKLRKSFADEDAEVEPHVGKMRDQLKNVLSSQVKKGDKSEAAMRNQFITLAALAQSYDGKVRHGEGKRSMFYEDAQQLLNPDNQQILREGYGDGSPEQIKKFVGSRKVVDTPMKTVKEIYKLLPKDFISSILTSGNMGTSLDVLGEDGKIKGNDVSKLHWAGDDGKRASNVNKERKLHLLKLILDQAGRDGYTGNLLDPRYMELEHVRGLQNVGEGEKGVTLDQLKEREHKDNHLWIGTGVNNEKSDQSMDEFLDGVNDKHGGKGKEDYVNINQLDESDQSFVNAKDARGSLLEDTIVDGQFTDDVTPEAIQGIFDNELAESDAMLKNGIKKTPVGMADKMRKDLGLVKDRKIKRSQLKTDKELFIPIIMKMASAQGEERGKIRDTYNELYHAAADRVVEMRKMTDKGPDALLKKDGSLNETGTWKDIFYKSLSKAGLVSKSDIEKYLQPGDMKRFGKFFEGLVIDLDTIL